MEAINRMTIARDEAESSGSKLSLQQQQDIHSNH
jgi:hypothetical protein